MSKGQGELGDETSVSIMSTCACESVNILYEPQCSLLDPVARQVVESENERNAVCERLPFRKSMCVNAGSVVESPYKRAANSFSIGPPIRQDYPLNLSI